MTTEDDLRRKLWESTAGGSRLTEDEWWVYHRLPPKPWYVQHAGWLQGSMLGVIVINAVLALTLLFFNQVYACLGVVVISELILVVGYYVNRMSSDFFRRCRIALITKTRS